MLFVEMACERMICSSYAMLWLDFIGFMREETRFSILYTILGEVCAAALECH